MLLYSYNSGITHAVLSAHRRQTCAPVFLAHSSTLLPTGASRGMAPASSVQAKQEAHPTAPKEEPKGPGISNAKSTSNTSRALRLTDERSPIGHNCIMRPITSTEELDTNTFHRSNEDRRAAQSDRWTRRSGSLRRGTSFRRTESGFNRSRVSSQVSSRRGRSSIAVVRGSHSKGRTSTASITARRLGSYGRHGSRQRGSTTERGHVKQIENTGSTAAPSNQRTRPSLVSTDSCGKCVNPPGISSAGTTVYSSKQPAGRHVANSNSSVKLQHAESAGSRGSMRRSRSIYGGTSTSSLQKTQTVLEQTPLGTTSSQVETPCPRNLRRLRESWDSNSLYGSGGTPFQRRSASSVSLNTPRRQLSAALYSRRHSNDVPGGAEVLSRVPEAASPESPEGIQEVPKGSDRPLYTRAITRLRTSTVTVPPALHRGGLRRGGTMCGAHQQRVKAARRVTSPGQRRRRSRKHRAHATPAVSSRLRRMLRLRSLSTSDCGPGNIQYHKVYLVLGLLHHRSGGDLVQNGFICLRAWDVTHETNALIAETGTFIWDRERAYPESPTFSASRTAAGACSTAAGNGTSVGAADSWGNESPLYNRDHATTGATFGEESTATTGQRYRGSALTTAGGTSLSPHETNGMSTFKCGSACTPSPVPVFTIGVRVAIKPSTPSEERKTTMYLRDYLATQLATYPFLRHYILITKYRKRRSLWPFSRHWRQSSSYSIIGKPPPHSTDKEDGKGEATSRYAPQSIEKEDV